MKAEAWLTRLGLSIWHLGRQNTHHPIEKRSIGVLTFEVASLMSKVVQLWYSLSDDEIAKLRDETLHLAGVKKLVSDDDSYLLSLAVAEMTENLVFAAKAVQRFAARCSDPVLHRMDHMLDDLMKNPTTNAPKTWEFSSKKMKNKVKKMERFVAASANLYQEMEILLELEQGIRRFHGNMGDQQLENLAEYKRKVDWQRQEVKYLKEISLWNWSYDYVVRLLSRSVFTILSRIIHVFGLYPSFDEPIAGSRTPDHLPRSLSISSLGNSAVHPSESYTTRFASGPLRKHSRWPISALGPVSNSLTKLESAFLSKSRRSSVSKGAFGGCMILGATKPVVLRSALPYDCEDKDDFISDRLCRTRDTNCYSIFSSKLRALLNAPPSTLGAAALSLHYANVILVIEKMAGCPHLIAPDARDDLYDMLPMSIRTALHARLRCCAKSIGSSVCDTALGAEWKEAMERILQWLAPLAHNMIRWQSERNFEQQHLTSKGNVLLLHTLYYADQAKTEAAITELLVGLNYLCRLNPGNQSKRLTEVGSTGERRLSSGINDAPIL